mmetsp:Transcript_14893/g.44885  ORF Transcript_14893/g.44885 Transcript_14893/m.44885 type:complete len:241 (+) Transcript_14893:899-1621(+)
MVRHVPIARLGVLEEVEHAFLVQLDAAGERVEHDEAREDERLRGGVREREDVELPLVQVVREHLQPRVAHAALGLVLVLALVPRRRRRRAPGDDQQRIAACTQLRRLGERGELALELETVARRLLDAHGAREHRRARRRPQRARRRRERVPVGEHRLAPEGLLAAEEARSLVHRWLGQRRRRRPPGRPPDLPRRGLPWMHGAHGADGAELRGRDTGGVLERRHDRGDAELPWRRPPRGGG